MRRVDGINPDRDLFRVHGISRVNEIDLDASLDGIGESYRVDVDGIGLNDGIDRFGLDRDLHRVDGIGLDCDLYCIGGFGRFRLISSVQLSSAGRQLVLETIGLGIEGVELGS
ncbi:unnamed protein product [Tilletia laevis]|uniref:Uncharacterized protein n=1 Tax=Tilletia laevis TaxID=157183 RepID=A0A9N8LRM1_9BASI|nr:unnamed protein product [Tilletia laevis]CAD6938234.1 unnamed protein product [Tilletia controversa]CAD6985628.1 unnamed protein product [Tilletia controversa]CAD7060474.1 unnamed protein product [Tilletia caries]